MSQRPPIRIDAVEPASNRATFIFLHGYGDDADGWTNIASQFQAAKKLPHLTWLFPNAPHNHEAMTTSWYTPPSFSPIPVGRRSSPSSHPQSGGEQGNGDEDEDENKEEILASVEYLSQLISEEVARGVPAERIVVGGFSQGCAVSLLAGLKGRWAGRVAAIVGLSGYLPKVFEGREKRSLEEAAKERDGEGKGKMQVFLAHGTRDMLVPRRVFRAARERVVGFVGEDVVQVKEYEGLGHGTRGDEFLDMCAFLETVVPP